MSRHYTWEWQFRDRSERLDLAWSDLFLGLPIISRAYLEGGTNTPEHGYTVLLWANKAKARRLASRLDRFFGAAGDLRRAEQ